ncbi:hypothetical protein AB0D63_43370 [Kitasatospora sp. NPDC048343]|uniref:hypothetical protein n=1 Tax=Kitasatospora sp. NPDC048343 TaxID=3154717 RepID=UPI0033ECCFE7
MTIPRIGRHRGHRTAAIPQEDLVRLALALATLNEAVRILVDPEAESATEALNRAMAQANAIRVRQ